MLIGRQDELDQLSEDYKSIKSTIAVLYGRRRVGKSFLLQHYSQKKKNSLYFEGLENEQTPGQILHFLRQWAKQSQQPNIAKYKLTSWNEVFDELTKTIKQHKQKTVIVFDEFQWMASQQTRLVSLIKFYWDNHWKNENIQLVLCGSIAHFMVERVIHSKALYGRIQVEMLIEELPAMDARKLLKQRSEKECLKYGLVLGFIPLYLESVNQKKSFEINIKEMFFQKNSYFLNEYEKIFFSQFKEWKTYQTITESLLDRPLSLVEISNKTAVKSGGGLTKYLHHLILAGFVEVLNDPLYPSQKKKRYRVADPYVAFFDKYVKNRKKIISSQSSNRLFETHVLPNWNPWLGYRFEYFCHKNAMSIAENLGFADKVETFGPLFSNMKGGHQIDLLFKRSDQVLTVCEVKYIEGAVEPSVISEFERKISHLDQKKWTIEKVLIAPHGASKSLHASNYFHEILDLKKWPFS
ncbi:MAG: AAA family ATPase [Pseudobdellovibrionaceae bacterium]